jgi:DNA-binding response OmpR family regulator
MQIAILELDPDRRALVMHAVTALGHDCAVFRDGNEFLLQLSPSTCDMLVIGPQQDGFDPARIVRVVRERMPEQFPVLTLIARSDADAMVTALVAGASDCQFAPLRRGELQARVQALLKRAYPEREAEHEELRFGAYVFELRTGRLEHGAQSIELTRKEFELALLLFRHLGRPLSRAYIQEAVWAHEPELPSRTIDTHISRVRTKLGLRPENGFRLAPVYSYGYRLETLPK